jgi:L-methionine (R)-S-oxide reductase
VSESIPDLRAVPRKKAYKELEAHVAALLDGGTDEVAAMATISALLHHSLGFLWTGFYRVVEPGRLLRVGPYQGSLGCLDIQFGRGVCGRVAASGRSMIVPDVQAFADHIACDARSRSEIVVPVYNSRNDLIAVLDIDSEKTDTFGAEDQEGLERLMSWFRKT